jgi:hypothetical protein
MNKKTIKIDRIKWAEAGIKNGYISVDGSNSIYLKKEALEPVTTSLFLLGMAIYAGGEGIGAIWDYASGGRSWQEVMRGGFNSTTESVQQFETGLIALEEEVMPLLQGTTLNIQEAVQDAIDQGRKTLELMNEELAGKGMATSDIRLDRQKEATQRRRIQEKNYILLYNAAKKPIGGTRPGSPETKKADVTPEQASKESGEAGKNIATALEEVKKNPDMLTEVATQVEQEKGSGSGAAPSSTPGATRMPSGSGSSSGRKLNPRVLGGA